MCGEVEVAQERCLSVKPGNGDHGLEAAGPLQAHENLGIQLPNQDHVF